MPVAIKGTGGGSVTLTAGTAAADTTLTLPNTTGTVITSATYPTASAIGQVPFSTDGSTFAATQKIVQGTAQASTSGTSIDFTSIPSWVKRITVMLNGVSTNGTSNILFQLGDSGGVETSGYLGSGSVVGASSASSANFTTGFGITGAFATYDYSGNLIICLQDTATNTWTANGFFGSSTLTATWFTSGKKATSAILDRIRITTVNGTDTFDAGSVNILYE